MSQTESVKIVISAEDNASVVMAQAAANLKSSQSEIRGAGQEYNDAGDALRRLASVFGQKELVNAADQAKGISTAWTKVQLSIAAGGKSAVLLKAGLMGIAAAAGVMAGKAIGDLVMRTKHWTAELEKAIQKKKELGDAFAGMQGQRFSDTMRDIDLEADPDKKRALQQDELDFIRQQRDGMAASIKQDEEKLRIQNESWGATLSFGQAGKPFRDLEAANIEDRKKSLAVLKQQAEELTRMLSPQEQEYLAKRKSNEETKAAISLQRQLSDEISRQSMSEKDFELMTAMRVTQNAEEQKTIQLLVEQKHAILAKKEAEAKAAEELKESQKARDQRTSDLKKELQDAIGIKIDTSSNALAGKESRFLSRSTNAQDFQRQAAEAAKKTALIQEKSKAVFDNMASSLKTLAETLGVTNIVEFN